MTALEADLEPTLRPSGSATTHVVQATVVLPMADNASCVLSQFTTGSLGPNVTKVRLGKARRSARRVVPRRAR